MVRESLHRRGVCNMIKPTLIVKLLKQRLAHNEAYLKQPVGAATQLGLDESRLDPTPGYRKAIKEENEFLRVVLEEAK